MSNTVLLVRVAKMPDISPLMAEQIFATIHGFAHEKVSFEIASINNIICFYVFCPTKLVGIIKNQIYAQYPYVEIEEADDYAYFCNDEFYSIGAELALTAPDLYPIKRYSQFDYMQAKIQLDPLAGITAALAKLGDNSEKAWIQIVVRPLKEKWRSVFVKCIKIMRKGIFMNIETLQKAYAKAFCLRSSVIRLIFFIPYIFFWFQGIFAGTKSFEKQSGAAASVEEQISKLHEKETAIVAAIDKVGKLLYEVNIRIVYVSKSKNSASAALKLREIAATFKQFNIPHLNGFCVRKIKSGSEIIKRFQKRAICKSFVLNIEELATVCHFPNITAINSSMLCVLSKKFEGPNNLPCSKNCQKSEFTMLGMANFRNEMREFGIKVIDRRRHVYIIGKTGMGKSTLLTNMIFADIHAGRGVAFIDPHGDTADAILNYIPPNRTNDVILFDPADKDFPVAFNMLENVSSNSNTVVCSGLIGVLKKIYSESWGPRLEYILRNTILSLLEYSDVTILGIPRMLQDKVFRDRVVRKINDPIVKNFWLNEFEMMNQKLRIEAISPILNKVGQFLSSPITRNILGQPKNTLDLRFAMDSKKIIIINLSKGKIGEDASALLGSMLISQFQIAAMSRANVQEKERDDFYLYVDEFQNFATDSFATILSEARKYKLNLVVANQYIAQIPEALKDAIFGNVGTMVSFQIGFDDAEYIATQFAEEVEPNDLLVLDKYMAYVKLLINGMPSKTFSFNTMPPPAFNVEPGRREKILHLSRQRYANKREIVEDKIYRWANTISTPGNFFPSKNSTIAAPPVETKPN